MTHLVCRDYRRSGPRAGDGRGLAYDALGTVAGSDTAEWVPSVRRS